MLVPCNLLDFNFAAKSFMHPRSGRNIINSNQKENNKKNQRKLLLLFTPMKSALSGFQEILRITNNYTTAPN